MYRTILVTTDGSELAEAAFPHVARLAAEDSEVVLISVIDSVSGMLAQTSLGATELATPISAEVAAESVEAQRAEAERHLERQRAALEALGVKQVATRIEGGIPGDEIVDCAREIDAEVIVMSTHGRSGWKRALLGSIADHVVRNAPGIPVLLVHPTGES